MAEKRKTDTPVSSEESKKLYLDFLKSKVSRDGIDKLIKWLETTDFFTAPASTKYHLNVEGGLCQHSLNVYIRLLAKNSLEKLGCADESIALCGLLHDLCKANFYKIGTRNVKNEATGQWEKVPFYSVDDQFPFGHGEKSVYLIERFIRLKPAEAIAIRWHMGAWDDSVQGGSRTIGDAFASYPLALALHIADMEATYYDEGTEEHD